MVAVLGPKLRIVRLCRSNWLRPTKDDDDGVDGSGGWPRRLASVSGGGVPCRTRRPGGVLRLRLVRLHHRH